MKFVAGRQFYGQRLDQILRYVAGDLALWIRDLVTGLQRLTFSDNFQSFAATFTAQVGETVFIPNRLGAIDLEWIVVDAVGGNTILRDPNSQWTSEFVYLQNAGSTITTVTVRFFRRL